MRLAGCTALVALVVASLAGCDTSVEYRVVKDLPSPVFGEEPPVVAAAPPRVQPRDNGSAGQQAGGQQASKPRIANRCPVPEWEKHAADNRWQYIIVHHSGPPGRGSAASFDRVHREANGWDELGYHFVIGNGTGSRDGQVEIGSRWVKQKHGAHCKTDDNHYNDYGIGICLVGNFELSRPSSAQLASLQSLVSYLSERYDIPVSRILGHSEAVKITREHRGTKCPGRYFDMDVFRQAIRSSKLASADN